MSAELVLATPALLLLVFGIIQFALWQHAHHVAHAAAQEGARAARTELGSATAGQQRAETFLDQLAPGTLSGATVTVTRGVDQVEVVIDGHSTAGLFDLAFPVRARVQAPVERFRPDSRAWPMSRRRTVAGGPARAGQGGSATAELALLAPLLLMLLLLVVAGGRVATSQQQVDAAARDAARAASIQRDPATATQAAQTTATASLVGEQLTCANLTVVADISSFAPGGSVTVAVACTVQLGDLTLLTLPGSRTMQATFTHPIDVFRGTQP